MSDQEDNDIIRNRREKLERLKTLGAVAMAFPDDKNVPTTDIPDAHILEANLGTYWYGAPIDKKDLLGKVVLWETWGS